MARCNNCGCNVSADNAMSCTTCGDILCTTCGDRLGLCDTCQGEIRYWN